MFAKGIIDPTKVVRSALQDAASIAGLLITTEAMMQTNLKKKILVLQCLLWAAAWVEWAVWVEWECNFHYPKDFKKGCNFAAFFLR